MKLAESPITKDEILMLVENFNARIEKKSTTKT